MRDTVAVLRVKDSEPIGVITLTFDYEEEAGRWTAECLETGTAAYADTLEAARREIAEAVVLQLSQVDHLGYIRAFLRDHGIKVFKLRPYVLDQTQGTAWQMPEAVGA